MVHPFKQYLLKPLYWHFAYSVRCGVVASCGIIGLATLLLLPALLSAQTAWAGYERKAEYWAERGQKDSALHYLRLKIQAARQSDSLAVWLWAHLDAQDIQDADAANSEQALQYTDDILKNSWRSPANTVEWEAFLYILTDRARHLFRTGRVQASVQTYQRSDSIFERYQFPDFDAAEYLYKPLGNHLTRLGDNEKALAVFQKALRYAAQNGNDPASIAGLYNNIGVAHWNQGDYPASQTALKRGLALPGIGAEKRALLLGALARTLLDEGKSKEAMRLTAEALNLLQKLPASLALTEYRSRLHGTAGLAFLQENQPAAALQSLQKALQYAHTAFRTPHSRDAGKIECDISAAWYAQKQPDAAMAAATRALSAVLQRFTPKNIEENPSVLDLFAENTIAEALWQKGRAAALKYEQTKHPAWADLALQCYDLAAQTYQILQETFFYASSKLNLLKTARRCDEDALYTAQCLYAATNDLRYAALALRIAERNKATVLLENLRDNVLLKRQTAPDVRFEKLEQIRRSIGWLEREMLTDSTADNQRLQADALRGEARRLEQEIRQAYPALFYKKNEQEIPFATLLQPGEHFLLMFAATNTLHLFYGNETGVYAWKQLPFPDTVQKEIIGFCQMLSDEQAVPNNPSAFFAAAHRWFHVFFPAAIQPPEKGLLVIPDGVAASIPFEVLLTEMPSADTKLRTAPYLIRRCPVRYTWSLAVLQGQKNRKTTHNSRLLGIAPGFAGSERGLTPLAGSTGEWQTWPGNASELLARHATRDAFLQSAADCQILHLATHANAGRQPGIELWDTPLFLSDIYTLTLQAELVALSACETSAGEDATGEGALSMARAFASAGAKSLLATAWKAGDDPTRLLFSAFYQYLSKGETKAEALRQAKLDYLTNAPNAALCAPRYWAALTLNGDECPLASGSFGGRYFLWWIAGMAVTGLVFFIALARFRGAKKWH
jgi:CHAT domain-containing protein